MADIRVHDWPWQSSGIPQATKRTPIDSKGARDAVERHADLLGVCAGDNRGAAGGYGFKRFIVNPVSVLCLHPTTFCDDDVYRTCDPGTTWIP